MTQKLSNVSLKQFRKFLTEVGCKLIRTSGGHEVWSRADLTRPIIFQTHTDPIPEFIVKNNLKTLKLTPEDYFRVLGK
mgnify:CR=1 FL=1|jgi:predicted RNA binding protein YcfA (HicA-like mRNA interferase family)